MAEVKSVCPYCGVGCGIVLHTEGGRIVKVAGDKTHPSNAGRLCTKGQTCAQPLASPGRLAHAYQRETRAHDPVRVPLDQAIRDTGRRLRAILDTHGPDAIALYVSGQMSLEAQYLANKLAKGYLRTRHIESNSRLCMASAGSGYKLSLGADAPPGAYDDFDHADLFLVAGANMADCHPILFLRMMDRVKQGARLIVVDPRRSATADKADLHLALRPGTDLALFNGLLHLLAEGGHLDQAFIDRHTTGWAQMPDFLRDYTPDAVARITGLSEADIRTAAAWIAAAPDWMSCWTMGLNQSTHGTWHTNALCNLHLATGALLRRGSGPFSLTGQPNAMGGREMGYMGPGLPGQRSALSPADRAFVEARWGLPAGTLRDDGGAGTVAMFDDMAAGRIKACWIICTNPVASVPNRDRVIDALRRAELVIAQDAFVDTDTNRHADVLLPGALWAEGDGVFINSERTLTLAPKAVEPPGDALPDWLMIARVARAMGFDQGFAHASAAEVFEEIRDFWNPQTGYDLRGSSHARLRTAPMQWPCPPDDDTLRHPIRYLNDGRSQTQRVEDDGTVPPIAFPTPDGRAVFFARPWLPPAERPDDAFPFVLNTGRVQHHWHTMTKTGKVATLNKLNPGPFVEIHPDDAAALELRDGATVALRSRRGTARLPARLSDRVQPGTCFAPFHWNDLFGDGIAINAVTHDAVDALSLQPELKHCAVALAPVEPPAAPLPADATEDPDMPRIDALAGMIGLAPAAPPRLDAHAQRYLQGYLAALRTPAARLVPGVPTLPDSAPLTPDTRALLDGMLAGLFSRAPAAHAAATAAPSPGQAAVAVLWASQTGRSEAMAAHCAERLRAAGLDVALHAMDEIDLARLAACERVLLLASTFGDGEPPDQAGALWAALNDAQGPALAGVRFAVLAFGDPAYSRFCGFGRALDARLEALGAVRLHARSDCGPDDDDAAQAWMDGVLRALADTDSAAGAATAAPLTPLDSANTPAHTPIDPPAATAPPRHAARLRANRRLNRPGADKDTRHIVLAPEHGPLAFEAGDALGVVPTNDPAMVDDILAAMALPAEAPVDLAGPGTLPLREACLRHYDITRLTPELLRFVQARAGDERLDALLAAPAEARQAWLHGRQLADLLHAHPVRAGLADWLAVLAPLQPRRYSISSSPKAHPDGIHLTVATVRYACEGRARGGVCSTFLADRAADASIPVFVQAARHFRPPADPSASMIMVGPGTGVAPFRAFMQERRATGARGSHWLFFGERHAGTDFYYEDEWRAYVRDGHLHRLDTAFSRDQAARVYVQDRMREHGAELWRWLQDGAHFYVCGDARRMARDVEAALLDIACRHGGMARDAAREWLRTLSRDKRYLRDVY